MNTLSKALKSTYRMWDSLTNNIPSLFSYFHILDELLLCFPIKMNCRKNNQLEGHKLIDRKAQKGYLCPNPRCDVITVHFDRNLRVKKVVREGIAILPIFGDHKRKG